MQIFFINTTQKGIAQDQCDQHCVKQILETMQMLSTVWYVHSREKYDEYYAKGWLIKPWTVPSHPSIMWIRQSKANYHWTVQLLFELLVEFRFRRKKGHSYEKYAVHLVNDISIAPDLPDVGFVSMSKEFQALPDELKHDDPVIAYRAFYLHDKKKFAVWKWGRNPPEWWSMIQKVHNFLEKMINNNQ